MEILQYPFFQNALIGTLIISIVSAIAGTYIVTRRQVFITGGITHACFGGLGFGYWLGVSPMWMAALFAVGGSLGVERLSRSSKVRRDTAIAVIWALGMSLGILFVFLSSGFVPDLNAFLFGNILTITRADLLLFAIYTGVATGFFFAFRHIIIAVSFDESFAVTRYLPVRFVNISMTVLVSFGIVLCIRMVGIMLLMSLMSLPQMVAESRRDRYMPIMWGALWVSLAGCVGGLIAATRLNVPASATIVILLVIIYLITSMLPGKKRIRKASGAGSES